MSLTLLMKVPTSPADKTAITSYNDTINVMHVYASSFENTTRGVQIRAYNIDKRKYQKPIYYAQKVHDYNNSAINVTEY